MVDLVRVSVGDETMANLRAVTRELQALEPSVASLSERAYGDVRLLSDEADRAWFQDSVHVGVTCVGRVGQAHDRGRSVLSAIGWSLTRSVPACGGVGAPSVT